jgi:UDP-glucose 4-epimerase
MKNILVTGGLGFIGSETVIALIKAGYTPIIADNLYNAKKSVLSRIKTITGVEPKFYEVNVCNYPLTKKIFEENPIDAVIHFAGYKAVGESVYKPIEYYKNNLGSALNVLSIMKKMNCHNFIFSSSATVYGVPKHVPLVETDPVGDATNPYGETKVMIERILTDAAKADPSLNVGLLRYFNPIGAHSSGLLGEDPNGIPNNLMPYISQVAIKKLPFLKVYGEDYPTPDGTGVRDYIHVVDLAEGHVAALKKLEEKPGLVIYNLGTGKGTSVLELVHAFEQANGVKIPYKVEARRAGDVAENFADVSKAEKELHWKTKLTIVDACRDAYNFQKKNPNGIQ